MLPSKTNPTIQASKVSHKACACFLVNPNASAFWSSSARFSSPIRSKMRWTSGHLHQNHRVFSRSLPYENENKCPGQQQQILSTPKKRHRTLRTVSSQQTVTCCHWEKKQTRASTDKVPLPLLSASWSCQHWYLILGGTKTRKSDGRNINFINFFNSILENEHQLFNEQITMIHGIVCVAWAAQEGWNLSTNAQCPLCEAKGLRFTGPQLSIRHPLGA